MQNDRLINMRDVYFAFMQMYDNATATNCMYKRLHHTVLLSLVAAVLMAHRDCGGHGT